MRKTLTLSVDRELASFLETQQGLIDPSALINKLFHEDMKRRGFQLDPVIRTRLRDDVIQEFEMLMDENTPAAD